MIGALFVGLRAFAARIPLAVWAIAAVLVTGWLYGNHRYGEGVADTEAKYAAARAQAITQARKADAEGLGVAEAGKASVEAENAKAREAAKGSEDPLRAGMEALR